MLTFAYKPASDILKTIETTISIQPLISRLPTEVSTYIDQAVNPGRGIMPPGPSFDDLSELAQLWDAPSSSRAFPCSTTGVDFALGALRSSDPPVRSDSQIGQDVGKIGGSAQHGRKRTFGLLSIACTSARKHTRPNNTVCADSGTSCPYGRCAHGMHVCCSWRSEP